MSSLRLAVLSFWMLGIPAFAVDKEVVVIGTLHGDHNRFPLYTFQTLEIVLKNLAPDLLLIEEDPKTYADKLYEKLSEDEYNKIRPVEIRKVVLPYARANNVKVIPTDSRIVFDEESRKLEEQDKKLLHDPKNRNVFETIMRGYESVFVDDYLTHSIAHTNYSQ